MDSIISTIGGSKTTIEEDIINLYGSRQNCGPFFVYIVNIDNTKLMWYNSDARKELELFEI